jgi:hypothetical protein
MKIYNCQWLHTTYVYYIKPTAVRKRKLLRTKSYPQPSGTSWYNGQAMPAPIYDAQKFPPADIRFTRAHGTHVYTLADGGRVTGISQPSWERFSAALGRVDDPGRFILSPELITVSPEPSPAEFADLPERVAERVDMMRDASRLWPDTTILLGSLTFDTLRPRNVAHFIRGGEVTGTNPKLPYMLSEVKAFHQAYDPAEHQQPDRATVAMICSDLLFHHWRGRTDPQILGRSLEQEYVNPITSDVTTVLVSALWATPHVPDLGLEYEERRFADPLRFEAGRIMHDHPSVQDVIIVDQLPAGTAAATTPFNMHARRL